MTTTDPSRPLEGKVAVITGAGRGIGREHALLLASQGASIVVNDRGGSPDGRGADEDPAESVVAEIVAAGGAAIADNSDVTDFTQSEAMIRAAVDTFGGLDILISNAGILRDRTLVSMTEDEWDAVIAVHLKGTFAPSHHAAVYWRDRVKQGLTNDARLITTSSPSGIYGNLGQTNYGAAKAGIASFTVIAAMELQRYGVTVNCIAPGALTRLTEPLVAARGEISDEHRENMSPRWIANVAAWLCGPDAAGVTGRVFDVRGRSVAVAEGWHHGPSGSQPDDAVAMTELMQQLVADARPNAAMDGI